jgi:uncharacterized protein with NRDE domain
MCTATWIRTEGGYEVFFNRDELATRKPALPPSVRERDGVRILAPEDGDAGGTWLGVNEHGVTIGLANGPRETGDGPFRSRGLLVLDLLASTDVADAERRLRGIDPSLYRPFSLFALDNTRLVSQPPRIGQAEGALLFSSSRDAERARSVRQALLDRMVREHGALDAELLAAFHRSHEPERGAFSPCMHREDASTVSFTRIRVERNSVEMQYHPGPPCTETRAEASASLRRIRNPVV